MPIHLLFEEAVGSCIGSCMKAFGHIDGTHQKQAFTLIRACRKLQSDYRKLKDPQALLHLTGKIQKVVDLCTKAGKAPVNEIEGEIHSVLTLADYQKMYGENTEAKSQWDIFVKGLQAAKQLDKSRQAKLHVLQVIRNKSSEWPSTKSRSVEIDFIFPTEFNEGRQSLLINQKLTLQEESTFEEVVWLFSRAPDKKYRITLQQNLQFYDHRLNEALHSLRMYQIFDSLHPIDTPSKARKQTYYVLLDRPVRLLFELRRPRIFGNVWKLGDGAGIIFKEYNGTLLESENIRQDMSVNAFHVNNTSNLRLNWKYAMDKALQDLEKLERSPVGRDGHVYKIQSADPEPPSPTPSLHSLASDDLDDNAEETPTRAHVPDTRVSPIMTVPQHTVSPSQSSPAKLSSSARLHGPVASPTGSAATALHQRNILSASHPASGPTETIESLTSTPADSETTVRVDMRPARNTLLPPAALPRRGPTSTYGNRATGSHNITYAPGTSRRAPDPTLPLPSSPSSQQAQNRDVFTSDSASKSQVRAKPSPTFPHPPSSNAPTASTQAAATPARRGWVQRMIGFFSG